MCTACCVAIAPYPRNKEARLHPMESLGCHGSLHHGDGSEDESLRACWKTRIMVICLNITLKTFQSRFHTHPHDVDLKA